MTPDISHNALELKTDVDQVALARDFVSDIARSLDLEASFIYDIELAVTEALTNVVEHAFDNDETQEMSLQVITNNQAFEIIISHQGKQFNPDLVPDPHMPTYLAERRVGGLGLFLMKRLMDDVQYLSEEAGQSQIILRKNLPSSKALFRADERQ
jgi:anti-sigma regulatory factor (Ser/Thr protein kinase)